jgi:uncharacterized protein (TIGR03435 family)
LKWAGGGDEHVAVEDLMQAVREELGLELKAGSRPVEVLIVDKASKRGE